MTDNKRPNLNQGKFTGSIAENIDTFLKQYNRAANINSWTDTDKA